jgi:hypothetical protein
MENKLNKETNRNKFAIDLEDIPLEPKPVVLLVEELSIFLRSSPAETLLWSMQSKACSHQFI